MCCSTVNPTLADLSPLPLETTVIKKLCYSFTIIYIDVNIYIYIYMI